MPTALIPALTPSHHVVLLTDEDATPLDDVHAARLQAAFLRGTGPGLLELAAGLPGVVLPPAFAWWRELGARYVTTICGLFSADETLAKGGEIPAPDDAELARIVAAAPPMPGAEYLSNEVCTELWKELDDAFRQTLEREAGSVQQLLAKFSTAWNVVGRVHFHLAENRKDPDAPFAFLATYTPRLSAHAQAQHVPLGQALREYAGASKKDRLLSLLLPVQKAAEKCTWLKEMVDSGELFHPLRWTAPEAFRFLVDVPQLESAGVVVKVPAGWNGRRPPRPKVSATVGTSAPSTLGMDALLDFRVGVVIDGEPLTAAEIKALLSSSAGLAQVRGKWVEVDAEKLRAMLERMREAEKTASEAGLGLWEAMRLLAGADVSKGDAGEGIDAAWADVTAGPWLAETLRSLRSPQGLAAVKLGAPLDTMLRPYQRVGVHWLNLLCSLRLGACLADDMGLGKTVQVLALLQHRASSGARPNILVAPASLLANWMAEASRFAPSLRLLCAHPSAMPADKIAAIDEKRLSDVDLLVTSYGTLTRTPALRLLGYGLAILDEAQAVKNAAAKQSRAVRELKAQSRIALTGTPVENRLSDLWSIFEFLNPGLLGNARQFTSFAKRLQQTGAYGPLRDLVRPYVLRRLKTDRSVISDLPDKTELAAHCLLSRKQAALYSQAVTDIKERLKDATGMQRRGLVLAFLMRFKQICNHPSQWLSDGEWKEEDSGKLRRLREIVDVVAQRQEKVLVFTQFKEIIAPLMAFLGTVVGRAGLELHGETPVKKRQELVKRFQDDDTVPFFVLSLKAGGVGLNLTAASHVVHFDRWWNPAVENQATDRAFRIGQKRNVLVHKFVCRGTVEEKIDAMIEGKRALARGVLEGGAELDLTEMTDDELLRLVSLDINAASGQEE